MSRLEGKVAVVTGGAAGNGRAIAVRFAAEGADLVVGDVDAQGMEETAKAVREWGRRAWIQRCDVAQRADVEALIAAAVRELGRIDVAVANAGVVEQETDCLQMTEAEWDRTIDVNLKGVFFTLQAAANRMIAQGGGGRLIAIGSIMGEWGATNAPAYSASKGGVKQLVRSFGIACGPHGITCNGIGPGFIETAMTRNLTENPLVRGFLEDRTPSGRLGKPEDVANAAVFLASDESSFVNGTMLFSDGGITAGLYSAGAQRAAETLARDE